MSHFSTLVILPPETTDISTAVSAALDPYSAHLTVDPYLVECYCRNNIAASDAHDYAEKNAPRTIDQYREVYWQLSPKVQQRTDWRQYVKDWQRIFEQAEQSHPLYQQYDPECEDCGGTGSREVEENPRSKWDWWQIGGEWTGALDDYDPKKDIENQEWCCLCDGTGNRPDAIYYADPKNVEATIYCANPNSEALRMLGLSRMAPATTEIIPGYVQVEWCNGCCGKGIKVKWPTQWASYEGDIRYVHSINPDFIPFAVLTCAAGPMPVYGPARTHRKRRIQKKWLKRYGSTIVGRREMPVGEWHERDQMEWFGFISKEKDGDQWRAFVRQLFEHYANYLGVIIHCHI